MTAEPNDSTEEREPAEPLNREERRALARGKKGKGGKSKQPLGPKKSKFRSQQPTGGVGKFQLPTKHG